MTLAEFLLARFKEDEFGDDLAGEPGPMIWRDLEVGGADRAVGADEHAEVRQIRDRWTARIKAECEAKRRIVERYAYLYEHGDSGDMRWVLPLLALPYADHPDYQQEWAV